MGLIKTLGWLIVLMAIAFIPMAVVVLVLFWVSPYSIVSSAGMGALILTAGLGVGLFRASLRSINTWKELITGLATKSWKFSKEMLSFLNFLTIVGGIPLAVATVFWYWMTQIFSPAVATIIGVFGGYGIGIAGGQFCIKIWEKIAFYNHIHKKTT